jgi:hypothetical protein
MDHIYAVIPCFALRPFIDVLHEGGIYEISLFSLVCPRTILRPVEEKFTMFINPSTVFVRKDETIGKFPTWVYCLTSFADLPVPCETPDRFVGALVIYFVLIGLNTLGFLFGISNIIVFIYFLDVIGKITAVSDIFVYTVPGRMHRLARRDILLSDPRLVLDNSHAVPCLSVHLHHTYIVDLADSYIASRL